MTTDMKKGLSDQPLPARILTRIELAAAYNVMSQTSVNQKELEKRSIALIEGVYAELSEAGVNPARALREMQDRIMDLTAIVYSQEAEESLHL